MSAFTKKCVSLYQSLAFGALFTLCQVTAWAQVDYIIIDSIIIEGNVTTKRHVILQELDFSTRDTIYMTDLSASINVNEKRLLSAGLFTDASINIKLWNTDTGRCQVIISLKEYWYIFPYIILELADRNFNVWKEEHNYSLDRINYGLAGYHINLTGNRDKLKLKLQHGYTRKYELKYEYPYLKNKLGVSLHYLYSNNREIIFKTWGNKPLYLRHPDDHTIFAQHKLKASLTHRSNAKTNQQLSVEYLSAKVDKIVSAQNPQYLGFGKSKLDLISVDYNLRFDNTIYPLYPLGGYAAEITLHKDGIGKNKETDMLWISAILEHHLPIQKNLILSNRVKIKYNFLQAPVPYLLYKAIGYKDDIITGYQLYVMDGRHFVIFSNALKFNVIDKVFSFRSKYLPSQFRVMNFKMFVRFNLDYGYTKDNQFSSGNSYVNRINYGYGPAIDLIFFNNFILTTQYGITGYGTKGLFFQADFNF